jgi:radical SAM protein with 4Fe4S-binding SPASM domain
MPDLKGGNVRQQDIVDIFTNSDAFNQVRAVGRLTTANLYGCNLCEFNGCCNAGCRGNAYTVFHDLLAPDPDCSRWKRLAAPRLQGMPQLKIIG